MSVEGPVLTTHNRGVRREMKNGIAALHCSPQVRGFSYVTGNTFEAWSTGTGELSTTFVVESSHGIPVHRKQTIDEMAPDESRSSGDQGQHLGIIP